MTHRLSRFLLVALAAFVMAVGLVGGARYALADDAVAPTTAPTTAAATSPSTDAATTGAASTDAAVTDDAAATDAAATADATTDCESDANANATAPEGIEYVYVDTQVVAVGEDEYIAIGLSDGDAKVSSATLELTPADGGDSVELEASALADNAMLFTANFADDSQATTWVATALTYALDGSDEQHEIDLPTEGDPYQFDVVRADTAAAIDAAPSENGAATVLAIGEDGKLDAAGSVEDGLTTADEAAEASTYSLGRSGGQDFVVAIDPGHGGYDSGAVGYGLQEKNLTLSIAQNMQAELNTYSGVSAVLTRIDDSYVGLQERVDKAVAMGARIFVSIHINSGAGGAARGAEVWVPNGSSYNYSAHGVGESLGNKIVAQLANLGLQNRGVKMRDYPYGSSSTYYPDGSRADYYSVIRNARKAGIPGIIVEHAFIDNAGDANFMKDENNLRAMGIADAQGVVNQFGFTKMDSNIPAGSTPLYRLYNPNTGYHHYTTSDNERNVLLSIGWRSEGVAFYVMPADSSNGGAPIYRQYNPYNGQHNWTSSKYENDVLVSLGWIGEGTAYLQPASGGTNVYRLYNPYSYEHLYTLSYNEYVTLEGFGWSGEGVGWKSVA